MCISHIEGHVSVTCVLQYEFIWALPMAKSQVRWQAPARGLIKVIGRKKHQEPDSWVKNIVHLPFPALSLPPPAAVIAHGQLAATNGGLPHIWNRLR